MRDKINDDLKTAMKAGDKDRVGTLRLVNAAIKSADIDARPKDKISDADILGVLAKMIKQRRDSIEQFAKAGRTDLVDKETAEIAILEHYLPPAITPVDIDAAVAAAIAETGASSPKDMGKVMKAVMPKLAGMHADGKAVNETVRRKLAGA